MNKSNQMNTVLSVKVKEIPNRINSEITNLFNQSDFVSSERKAKSILITVIKGKIFDVAVDLRKNSKTYGKYYSKILSEKNSLSIYIPPGFAHGFCALDKENFVVYSCTEYRDAKSEIGIKYNNPAPKSTPIPWFNKHSDTSKKQSALQETESTNYVIGVMSDQLDYDEIPAL